GESRRAQGTRPLPGDRREDVEPPGGVARQAVRPQRRGDGVLPAARGGEVGRTGCVSCRGGRIARRLTRQLTQPVRQVPAQKSNRSMFSLVKVSGLPRRTLSPAISTLRSRPACIQRSPGRSVSFFNAYAVCTVR